MLSFLNFLYQNNKLNLRNPDSNYPKSRNYFLAVSIFSNHFPVSSCYFYFTKKNYRVNSKTNSKSSLAFKIQGKFRVNRGNFGKIGSKVSRSEGLPPPKVDWL